MLTQPERLLLAALACYRLAQLVAIDDGPGDVFRRLRIWASGLENDTARGFIGALVHCPYCLGLYWAVILAALVIWPRDAGDGVLIVLGIAGAQAYLQGPRDGGEE